MKRFPDHARVVFIGDSITAAGTWIAHIYDYYLRNFPDADIRMYNSGISGGSARSALMYFEENSMVYRPTHAVIMLGMNDVWRDNYEVEADGSYRAFNLPRWQEALTRYENGMRELAARLQQKGVSMTFITPTCYDESTNPRLLDKVGCDAALEYAGEIARRLAEETNSDFVNFHAPLRLLNAAKNVIRDDRVHPVDEGHVLMARLFLHAQGLTDEPTVLTMNDMPDASDLLPVNQARREAEIEVRKIWNAEWLILREQPRDEEARRAFLKSYSGPSSFFDALRDNYLENGSRLKELTQAEMDCVDACVR